METGPDNLIGHINYAAILDDRIFILDENISKSIQVYDIHGKFIARVGKLGNGPGEYAIPMFFRIDKTTRTIVVNGGTNRLLVYDLDTYQYLYTQTTPEFNVYAPLSDGNYAWWKPIGYKKDDEIYRILITDSLLNKKNYYHLRDYYIRGDVLFSREVFYTLKNKTYYYEAHNPIVYEITVESEKPAYKVKFGHHQFPSPDFLKGLTDGRELIKTNYIICYQLFETDKFILSKYWADKKYYIGIYNKKEKKTYRYADFHTDDTIFNVAGYIGTTEDGRFIMSVPTEPLKRRYIQQEDLRAIGKTVSEEDNPILCIVTFK